MHFLLHFTHLFVSLHTEKNRKRMKTSERDALITANMGYVVTLARQYKSELLSTDDLISEGSIGLMKAADKYV